MSIIYICYRTFHFSEYLFILKLCRIEFSENRWKTLYVSCWEKYEIVRLNFSFCRRYWNIYAVNETTGQTIREIYIKEVLKTWNSSSLSIDPLFLQIGMYKLVYTVDVKATPVRNLVRSAFTYHQVTAVSFRPQCWKLDRIK